MATPRSIDVAYGKPNYRRYPKIDPLASRGRPAGPVRSPPAGRTVLGSRATRLRGRRYGGAGGAARAAAGLPGHKLSVTPARFETANNANTAATSSTKIQNRILIGQEIASSRRSSQ